MKRDMDLIRLILLKIEACEVDEIEGFSIKGYDESDIKHNGELLFQAGMVTKFTEDSTGELIVGKLTWDGYDYLDKIRDNTIWKKTKDIIAQKGLPLIIDTIKTISMTLITATTEGVVNSILKNGGTL